MNFGQELQTLAINNIAKFLCSQESVFVRQVGQDQIVTNVFLIGIVLKKAQKIVMHPMTAFVLVLLITSYAMKLWWMLEVIFHSYQFKLCIWYHIESKI